MLRKIAVVYCRIVEKISEWSGKVLGLLLIPLTLILLYEVIARYFFENPTIWAHETSIYLFGFISVMSGAYVLLERAHVTLDLLYAHVSDRKKALLDTIVAPVFLFTLILMIWKGSVFAVQSWKILETSSTVWNPPLYPIKTVIPLAAVLLILQVGAKLIRDIFFVITGKELT